MVSLRAAFCLVALAGTTVVRAQEPAHVIFVHPDGSSLNAWNAARAYWSGPDGELAWDRLPVLAVYRGQMADRLGGTSNGGATTHAFGVKVRGQGSFGRDGARDDARPILSASGFAGSVLREAAAAGHPVGVVNDGDLPEPGTGAFWAEVGHRDQATEIARQLLDGRPGHEGVDTPPVVALGGGEAFFLPKGTPPCGDEVTPDCAVHVDPVDGRTAQRDDGRNLVREFLDAGHEVLRTRAEFERFRARLEADAEWTPRVLGLFAADDLFNDVSEERLLALGLVRIPADPREGDLLLYGSEAGRHGHDPPRASEMHAVALELLRRHAERAGKPFLLITEVESCDNFGNQNNAIGTLVALRDTDRLIAATAAFIAREPRTFVLTAADSDASSLQLVSPPAERVSVNPTGVGAEDVLAPTDGPRGRASGVFVAAPDRLGRAMEFRMAWIGKDDVHGAILARAAGWRASEVGAHYAAHLSNTDVYTVLRGVLFGEALERTNP